MVLLSRAALRTRWLATIAALSAAAALLGAVAVLWLRLNSAWLVLAGGLVGALLR